MVIAAIAYFILPADIIPEDIYGPYGYADDVFLCAFVGHRVLREVGRQDILLNSWDGEAPIVPLIEDILAQAQDLIDDRRRRILWYIGYKHLSAGGGEWRGRLTPGRQS